MAKKTIFSVVLVLVVVLLVGYFGYAWVVKPQTTYSAVYLKSGELYVGKLFHFPKFKLIDGYLLSTVRDEKDPKKTLFRLNPLKDAMWSPEALYLNRDQVLFYAPLKSDSKVALALKSAQKKDLDAIEGENPLQQKESSVAPEEQSTDTVKGAKQKKSAE